MLWALGMANACYAFRRSAPTDNPCWGPSPIAEADWKVTADSAVIDGTVFRVDTTANHALSPLPDAYISANGGSGSRSAISDSAGHFRFGDLPPGRYIVSARLVGYNQRVDTLHVVGRRGFSGHIHLMLNVMLRARHDASVLCM